MTSLKQWVGRLRCVLALGAAAIFLTLGASAAEPAKPGELDAIRAAIDRLTQTLRDQGRLEALQRRIESTERRAGTLEQQLQRLVEEHQRHEARIAELQGALQSVAQMEALDTTGGAASALATERSQNAEQQRQETQALARLDGRISALQAEVAAQRTKAAQLQQQADKLLGLDDPGAQK